MNSGKRAGLGCIVLTVLPMAFSGCQPPPPEAEVRAAVERHFEARHYRVKDLDIKSIEPVSLSEKTYMGTRGYLVEVGSITLEACDGSPSPERFTFRDVTMRIRENPAPEGGWLITNIAGIPLP